MGKSTATWQPSARLFQSFRSLSLLGGRYQVVLYPLHGLFPLPSPSPPLLLEYSHISHFILWNQPRLQYQY
ncbi:hypothetical protein VTN77DRAFT_5920 [Rasamsonia byssochlamydoides]|uniref:uncharacterized protein n=1 Tax=Rasamsonia byssochlamydoides TaxID=89139 RepID=UPI003742AD96